MNKIGIIPARMSSSRFPGKPMETINGIPMIGHCFNRAKLCRDLDEVYVATCDLEIDKYIKSIGGRSIMTKSTHERASDRTSEALIKIEKKLNTKFDIVVLLQGDEPMTTPEMITASIKPMIVDKNIEVVNLYTKIKSIKEFNNPNEVKVVVDKNENAIYFSREPIPSLKKYSKNFPKYKQVCVIPFRREFLIQYNNMKQTNLEIIESVDMLRVIENGKAVKMVYIDDENFSVDTHEDIKLVRKKMLNDSLVSKYQYV